LSRVLRSVFDSPAFRAVLVALFAGALLLLVSGYNPLDVYRSLAEGGLVGSGFRNTLKRSVPTVGMGLSVAVAIRAGLLNLGMEGQMLLGALCGSAAALALPGGPVALVIALLVGVVAGGAWALISAVGQTRLGLPILMTSLLMNFVARGIASYTVRFHLNDEGIEAVATPQFDPSTRLPSIPGSDSISFLEGTDWSLVIVLAVVAGLALWERRTVTGYETKMIGLNTAFGRYGGVPVERRTVQVMFLSGAIAGLVGVMLVLGQQGRYFDGELVRSNFAWIGLMVALLAANRPVLVAIAGFGFAALQIGGLAIQREVGVESQFSLVVQALIIVALSAVAVRRRVESTGRED
jgi:ABC-type uncharacterized transport system permease subunit